MNGQMHGETAKKGERQVNDSLTAYTNNLSDNITSETEA